MSNIIAGGLDDSFHPEGPSSKGLNLHNTAKLGGYFTVWGNYFPNTNYRTPRVTAPGYTEIIGNLHFNWHGSDGFQGAGPPSRFVLSHDEVDFPNNVQGQRLHLIRNVYTAGWDTGTTNQGDSSGLHISWGNFEDSEWEDSLVYVYDNIGPTRSASDPDSNILDSRSDYEMHSGAATERFNTEAFWPFDYLASVFEGEKMKDTVQARAGNRPLNNRNQIDSSYIAQYDATDAAKSWEGILDDQESWSEFGDSDGYPTSADYPENTRTWTWKTSPFFIITTGTYKGYYVFEKELMEKAYDLGCRVQDY